MFEKLWGYLWGMLGTLGLCWEAVRQLLGVEKDGNNLRSDIETHVQLIEA